MAVYRPGLGREAPRDAQQNAIDIVAGLTPAANRIGLKQVFQKYGDITVCWLPPVDKRNEMAAYIRYERSDSAKAALAACDSGEVVLNGIPLKAEYRSRGQASASSAYAARERGGYNRSGKRRSYGALSSRSRSRERRRAKYGYSSSSSSSRSRSRSYSGDRRSRSYDSRDATPYTSTMAVGKNKRLTKGKKGGKKKVGDPFLKKEWYSVKAPTMFSVREAGKTLVTKTTGTKIASEALKGRICEVNLADLNSNEDHSFRKIKLEVQEVQGRNALTDFHGMDFTRDKLCSLIRKWQTLIEAHVDVKTTDGYILRLFSIGFTKKRPESVKANCYASGAQIRRIRKKMVDIMAAEASKCRMSDLVKRFVTESIGAEIEKQTRSIYPLKDCYIRKVKILKKPKFDLTRLMELHTESAEEGTAVDRNIIPESEEAKIQLGPESEERKGLNQFDGCMS
ncbi:40S ribosomal protein S3-1, partial [Perkinsus olseni]